MAGDIDPQSKSMNFLKGAAEEAYKEGIRASMEYW
jgi:hypothetical protein